MNALKRFLSGGLLATAVVVVGSAFTPADLVAQQEIVLACTDTACCTVDSQTGKIIDCFWKPQ
jgi:hypothetical protein